MKKKRLKKISLNKKVVSNFKVENIKGGVFVSQRYSDIYYDGPNGNVICCTFVGC